MLKLDKSRSVFSNDSIQTRIFTNFFATDHPIKLKKLLDKHYHLFSKLELDQVLKNHFRIDVTIITADYYEYIEDHKLDDFDLISEMRELNLFKDIVTVFIEKHFIDEVIKSCHVDYSENFKKKKK